MNRHLIHHLLLLLGLFGLLSQPGHAQTARQPVRKSAKRTFTMIHPVSKIKLTFQEPALLETTGEVAAWRKIVVHLSDDTFTIDAGADNGYMIDTKSKNADSWSPDGKYIALYQPHSILDKKSFTSMSLVFLDLTYGEAIPFQTRDRRNVGKDDFRGWVTGKPHVVRTGGATNAAGEAYPADELTNP